MNKEKELKSAILKKDEKRVEEILDSIDTVSIDANLYQILSMATLHSTPNIIKSVIREFSLYLSDKTYSKVFEHIKKSSIDLIENYKSFMQSALINMHEYTIEEKIIWFINEKSDTPTKLLYKQLFLESIKRKNVNIRDVYIKKLEKNIYLEKISKTLKNF